MMNFLYATVSSFFATGFLSVSEEEYKHIVGVLEYQFKLIMKISIEYEFGSIISIWIKYKFDPEF